MVMDGHIMKIIKVPNIDSFFLPQNTFKLNIKYQNEINKVKYYLYILSNIIYLYKYHNKYRILTLK